MYVEFMKNFFLADSSELNGVRVISASWAQKRFDSYFLDMMYVAFMKNFFLADSSEWWVLESFRPPEPKNVWFPLSRHDVRRVHENFFSLIRANWWALESFRSPEPKNVWLLQCRHDVRRVHENFFVADSSELMSARVISAFWAKKRLIPTL